VSSDSVIATLERLWRPPLEERGLSWPKGLGEMSVVEQIERVGFLAGRNCEPEILWDCWFAEDLDVTGLRALLPSAWSGAEFPERCVKSDQWVGWFHEIGFFSDLGRPQPSDAITVYRGSTWERRHGMSWTTDDAIARRFADPTGFHGFGLTHYLLRAVVTPVDVLAFIDDVRPGESEVVVDPGAFEWGGTEVEVVKRVEAGWRSDV
jgi:hypothetical protein